MARTDIHRPSAPEFDPEAYDFDSIWDMAPEIPNPKYSFGTRLIELREQGIRRAPHQSHGVCGHCGARIRYAAILVHRDTGTWITVGETCLDSRFTALTKDEFDRLRKQAKLDRERINRQKEREARFAALEAIDPRLSLLRDEEAAWEVNPFVGDVALKAQHYDLSEKQVTAVLASLDRHEQRQKERAEELANAEPAPEGRVEVAGTVLKVKLHDSGFGLTEKMTVKDERGFRVWATVPSGKEVGEGDRVTFMATLEPSRDDAYFAFAKRPTRLVVTEETPE